VSVFFLNVVIGLKGSTMRKQNGLRPKSGNKSRVRMSKYLRHKTDNVVTVSESIVGSDKTAAAEGDAIIRRGQGARSDKAFHDSILWNRNVRKIWIRRMLQLSDETEVLKIYLQSGKK